MCSFLQTFSRSRKIGITPTIGNVNAPVLNHTPLARGLAIWIGFALAVLEAGMLGRGCDLSIMWAVIATFRNPSVIAMRAASQILTESFLEVRAKLLEVAATLDRIDRSLDAGSPLPNQDQVQREQIDSAIEILLSEGSDRAERLQQLFSRQYESDWRKQMDL